MRWSSSRMEFEVRFTYMYVVLFCDRIRILDLHQISNCGRSSRFGRFQLVSVYVHRGLVCASLWDYCVIWFGFVFYSIVVRFFGGYFSIHDFLIWESAECLCLVPFSDLYGMPLHHVYCEGEASKVSCPNGFIISSGATLLLCLNFGSFICVIVQAPLRFMWASEKEMNT